MSERSGESFPTRREEPLFGELLKGALSPQSAPDADLRGLPDLGNQNQFVGHYELVRQVGCGGMGKVFEARDRRFQNRTVAFKQLKEEAAGDGLQRQRFLREANAAADLSHPNIIQIHEVGE